MTKLFSYLNQTMHTVIKPRKLAISIVVQLLGCCENLGLQNICAISSERIMQYIARATDPVRSKCSVFKLKVTRRSTNHSREYM